MNRNQMLVTLAAAMAAVALMASSHARAQAAQGGGDLQGGPHASTEESSPETRNSARSLQSPEGTESHATGRASAPYGDTRDSSSAGTSESLANFEAQRRADCLDRSGAQVRATPECATASSIAHGWPGHEDPQRGEMTAAAAANAAQASQATQASQAAPEQQAATQEAQAIEAQAAEAPQQAQPAQSAEAPQQAQPAQSAEATQPAQPAEAATASAATQR